MQKGTLIPTSFSVIPSILCHSERKRGIQRVDASLRLRSVQHDKSEDVIPSESEESSAWMLHFFQHDSLTSMDASLC